MACEPSTPESLPVDYIIVLQQVRIISQTVDEDFEVLNAVINHKCLNLTASW
jgi:hypothetical protein